MYRIHRKRGGETKAKQPAQCARDEGQHLNHRHPISPSPRKKKGGRSEDASNHLSRVNSDGSRPRALVALGGEDLVVVGAELQAVLLPGIKVRLDVDGAADALLLADGPELREGRRAVDGGLVDARGLEDVVVAAVRGDGALLGCGRCRVVAAVGLDDVVLDERVASPAVERDV